MGEVRALPGDAGRQYPVRGNMTIRDAIKENLIELAKGSFALLWFVLVVIPSCAVAVSAMNAFLTHFESLREFHAHSGNFEVNTLGFLISTATMWLIGIFAIVVPTRIPIISELFPIVYHQMANKFRRVIK